MFKPRLHYPVCNHSNQKRRTVCIHVCWTWVLLFWKSRQLNCFFVTRNFQVIKNQSSCLHLASKTTMTWTTFTDTRVLLYIAQDEVESTHCRKTEPKHKTGRRKKLSTCIQVVRLCVFRDPGCLMASLQLFAVLHILQLTPGREFQICEKKKNDCNKSQRARIRLKSRFRSF